MSRAVGPTLPAAPPQYSASDEARFRRAVELAIQQAMQLRPADFVTISSDAPSGEPALGKGSLWVRTS